MAEKLIAFDEAGNLVGFTAKVSRETGKSITSGEKAQMRSDLGTPASADGLYTAQEIRDRAFSKAPQSGWFFDGTDDTGQISHNTAFDFGTSTDFSVCLRFYISATKASAETLLTSLLAGTSGFEVKINASGRLVAYLSDGSNTVNSTDDGDALAAGWHTAVVTFDRNGNMVRLVDGEAYGTADDISSVVDITNSNAIDIGNLNGTQFFGGVLNEIAVYKKALTTAEALLWHSDGFVAVGDQWANVSFSLRGGNIVSTRWVDESTNKADATLTGAVAIFKEAGRQVHSPSDSSADTVERITAGTGPTTLRDLRGNGVQRGIIAHQRAGGQGYDEQLNSGGIADTAQWVLDDNMIGGQPRGFIFITSSGGTGYHTAIFALRGTGAEPVIVSDPFNLFSVSESTASKVNVFRDAANSNKTTIENLSGGTINLTIRLMNYYLA